MKNKIDESRILRDLFGKFATGVSVVSFLDEVNKPFGITTIPTT